jgi:hypothetical protein
MKKRDLEILSSVNSNYFIRINLISFKNIIGFLVLIPCIGRYLGNYIVILYLLVKLIYITNTIIQVYLISGLLSKNFIILTFIIISSKVLL